MGKLKTYFYIMKIVLQTQIIATIVELVRLYAGHHFNLSYDLRMTSKKDFGKVRSLEENSKNRQTTRSLFKT